VVESAGAGAARSRPGGGGGRGEILPGFILAIRLLLLTGARKGEILGLTWDMVDLDLGRIRLPDSKTGAKAFPLNQPAVELLGSVVRRDDQPYVCGGQIPGRPIVGLQKVWGRIRAKAGLEGVRLYDLRHTFASVGVGSGLGLTLVGGLLGHREPSTTARYSHLADDPLREASNQIGARIGKALEGTDPR